MFVDMLRIQREERFDLGSVETGVMAGAPCPQELCRNVVDEMNMKNFTVSKKLKLFPSCCSISFMFPRLPMA